MDIITNKKGFWLFFHIKYGNGTEWMDYNLPFPTYLKHINRGYLISWLIEGYFGTKKGQKFLNDIIARFLITFSEIGIERLPYSPNSKKDAHIFNKAYSLKKFSRQLKSLKHTHNYAPKRADKFADYTFWAIKLKAENMIRTYNFIVYEQLEQWALTQFLGKKERSTIKAKCRSVWRYYADRDFKLPKKYENIEKYLEATKMNRIEHCKKIAKQKEIENYKKIVNLITGLYSHEYKRKNGQWNISKIAKETGLSRPTIYKHINNYLNSN